LCARGEITSRYRHIQPLERAAGKKRRWMKSRYMHREPLERERERERVSMRERERERERVGHWTERETQPLY
jgi:hypothetical protein